MSKKWGVHARVLTLACLASILLSGCSTLSKVGDWFADEEELEVRRLKPIEAKFSPQEVWRKDINSGVKNYFSRLKPAVGYGKVFAANRQGQVFAFDQESGKKVWEKDYSTYPETGFLSGFKYLFVSGVSAKIAGGITTAYETIYFGTEDGDVYALDANSGEEKWHIVVKGEVLAAPAVDASVVVVNTGSGRLFGLDANSGEQLWEYESEVPALSLRGISAPAAANGGAIVGTATGKLVVNILESGQNAWDQAIASPSGATELERIVDIDSQPLVAAGNVYVISFDGTLASVELRTGRVLWKREYKAYRRVSIAGNSLFVVDDKSNVYALDRRNGVELWSQGGLKGRRLTGAEPVKDYVVVGDNFGFLHWLKQEDGSIDARMAAGNDDDDEAVYVAPVADADMLYVQTRNGELLAVKTP